jgi:hypothetical protein
LLDLEVDLLKATINPDDFDSDVEMIDTMTTAYRKSLNLVVGGAKTISKIDQLFKAAPIPSSAGKYTALDAIAKGVAKAKADTNDANRVVIASTSAGRAAKMKRKATEKAQKQELSQ